LTDGGTDTVFWVLNNTTGQICRYPAPEGARDLFFPDREPGKVSPHQVQMLIAAL